jgi:thiol-disulfide isomerase/thioredoxin
MKRGVLALLLATGLLAACGGGRQSELASRVIPVDKRVPAPAVRGDLLQGGTFDLGAHKGSVVVVNFWASYCAPCRTEAPELEGAYAATKADGVVFVGINVRDQHDPALAYLADVKPSWGSLFDPSAALALDFDVPPNTIPATLVVDRKGRLAAVFRSAISRDVLEPVVRNILAEQT